jgi:DNA-binding SARP family transcriptional activator
MRQSTCSKSVIALLDGFEVAGSGKEALMPLGAQRLLAFLALANGSVHRAVASERLWPDCNPARAAANLRSALWRGRRIGDVALIECNGSRLQLAPTVQVDLKVALEESRRLTETGRADGSADIDHFIPALSRALLPHWMDEWLILERERWDQIRLHTLEGVAQSLMGVGRYLPALEAALAAVAIEPVRESAHRTVVEVYIAEGNAACALKHYQRYRGLVQRELGVSPSRQMIKLVQPLAGS